MQAIFFTVISCLCVHFLYAATIINSEYISIFLFNLTVDVLINGCGFDRFNNHWLFVLIFIYFLQVNKRDGHIILG